MNQPTQPTQATPANERQPVSLTIVAALDDVAQVIDAIGEHFTDPIDTLCLDTAAHTLRELAATHRPHATQDDPEEDTQ